MGKNSVENDMKQDLGNDYSVEQFDFYNEFDDDFNSDDIDLY